MRPPLPICRKCGWHDGPSHENSCFPVRGKNAERLAALVPEVPSTKLGFGDNHLTFTIGKKITLSFYVNGDGTFAMGHFFFPRDMTEASVAEVVRTMAKLFGQESP